MMSYLNNRREKHVLLAHHSCDQNLATQVSDKLEDFGFPIFRIVKGSKGSQAKEEYQEQLDFGVENAAIVILFNSSAFNDSSKCQEELRLCLDKSLPVIPLLTELEGPASFMAKDAVLEAIGGKLYLDFKKQSESVLEIKCQSLAKEIMYQVGKSIILKVQNRDVPTNAVGSAARISTHGGDIQRTSKTMVSATHIPTARNSISGVIEAPPKRSSQVLSNRTKILLASAPGRLFQHVLTKKYLSDRNTFKMHPTSDLKQIISLEVAPVMQSYWNEEQVHERTNTVILRNAATKGMLSYEGGRTEKGASKDCCYTSAQVSFLNEDDLINCQEWKINVVDEKVFQKDCVKGSPKLTKKKKDKEKDKLKAEQISDNTQGSTPFVQRRSGLTDFGSSSKPKRAMTKAHSIATVPRLTKTQKTSLVSNLKRMSVGNVNITKSEAQAIKLGLPGKRLVCFFNIASKKYLSVSSVASKVVGTSSFGIDCVWFLE